MKVLLVHNEYGKRSGEEAVFDKMESMLTAAGHQVARLTRSTADARESLRGKMSAFVSGIYSPEGVRAMRDAIERERPDVVNVHNLYPFISPVALRECCRAGVPVVMTVHNYRLLCPTGLFMRNGGPCEDCLRRGDEWACLRHNCEGSLPKSLAYAARNAAARLRGDYMMCVDKFACLTEFQRGKLVEGGFAPDRIVVIPNSVDFEDIDHEDGGAAGEYVGYVGRLSREKGIGLIIEAARRCPDVSFKLAGAVSEPDLVADLPSNVTLAGFLGGKELDNFFKKARFMIMASTWYEGFPMSILEAGAHCRCVIGPDHGGFSEILRQTGGNGEPIGRLFAPGDASGLATEVAALWANPTESARLGLAARRAVETRYSGEAVMELWDKVFNEMRQKHNGQKR